MKQYHFFKIFSFGSSITIVLFLFFNFPLISNAVIYAPIFKSELPPDGAKVNNLECEVLPNKEIYRLKETVEFNYVCSSPDRDSFPVPSMLMFPLGWGDGITIQNEKGEEFKLIKLPMISFALLQGTQIFKNKEIISKAKISDESRVIIKTKWIDTWEKSDFDMEQKFKLFKEGTTFLPAGKYTVWLDTYFTWKNFEGDQRLLLLNEEKLDSKNFSWWSLKGKTRKAQFEVREGER